MAEFKNESPLGSRGVWEEQARSVCGLCSCLQASDHWILIFHLLTPLATPPVSSLCTSTMGDLAGASSMGESEKLG